ncbi:hypothetical protein RJ641_005880 [Dillenia turbinata]|uniref:Uncharacterized protein n=1 Tax=Dillenia turbinata TaxID=194707 RepID=A0AAN8V959_9MAGN
MKMKKPFWSLAILIYFTASNLRLFGLPLIPMTPFSRKSHFSSALSSNSTVTHIHCYCSCLGDQLLVKVKELTSAKTLLPYEFCSLPYCQPDGLVSYAESLGEVLQDCRPQNSVFVVLLNVSSQYLAVLCNSVNHEDKNWPRLQTCNSNMSHKTLASASPQEVDELKSFSDLPTPVLSKGKYIVMLMILETKQESLAFHCGNLSGEMFSDHLRTSVYYVLIPILWLGNNSFIHILSHDRNDRLLVMLLEKAANRRQVICAAVLSEDGTLQDVTLLA